jgi:hypothetical protein
MSDIYQSNFNKMEKLGFFEVGRYKKIKSQGFMDFVLEVIDRGEKYIDYSLAHYFEMNGDLMVDPEMVVRVFPSVEMVDVLSYRQDSLGLNQEVYIERDGKRLVNLRLKRQLNSFLGFWLRNLISQGFSAKGGEKND